MKPLVALPRDDAKRLRGIVFDLDDTLLDHGALREDAYRALFRLREAGLRLVGSTGRPAGWAEVLVRQWPVDAIVAENGAIGLARDTAHHNVGAEIAYVADPNARGRRDELLAIADALLARVPEAALADDNAARWTDVTIDIGEHRTVTADGIRELRSLAAARGVRTLTSSVHLHLSWVAADKASGTLALLARRFGEDPSRARHAYGFVGDSENDAAAFAAFTTTFGVANVARYVRRLSVPPRFVATQPMGLGFAEIAARLVALRGDGEADDGGARFSVP